MTIDSQKADLQERIKVLTDIGETAMAEKLRKELKNLANEPSNDNLITIPGLSEEQMEAAASKFAIPGAHLSEMGMPSWKTHGVSLEFPFTIIEEGADNGKTGSLFTGVSPSAAWKLREILDSVGVKYKAGGGGVQFNPAECVGKKFKSVWTEEKDSRSAEEGGKGSVYSKPTTAIAMDSSVEKLV